MSKENLIGQVWANTFVTDDVLTHAISELRKAFGDDSKKPQFIHTIPRSGYRLIAAVIYDPPQQDTDWQSARVIPNRSRYRQEYQYPGMQTKTDIDQLFKEGFCAIQGGKSNLRAAVFLVVKGT